MLRFAFALSVATVALFASTPALACPGEGGKGCACGHAAKGGGDGEHACDPKACSEKDCPHAKKACSCHGGMAMKAGLKEITVAEAAALGAKATFVDVNSADTRTKQGVIPGAKLLSSSTEYDVAKELPSAKDGKLVFYCAGLKCNASRKAAQRAVEAGFQDVNVLPEGIAGWKAAGQPTANVPAS